MDTELPPEPSGRSGAKAEAPVEIGQVVEVTGTEMVVGLLDDLGDRRRAARIGALVLVPEEASRSVGMITGLHAERRAGHGEPGRRVASVQLIGELVDAPGAAPRFRRGISMHPTLDAKVLAASGRDLAVVYARPQESTARIGRLGQDRRLAAYVVTDRLLGKHFAVLGTTGAGKSCAVTVILRSILEGNPNGHIVLLDPHNEYARAFDGRAERIDPTNLQLPYWLLTFEEIAHILVNQASSERAYAEAAILKDAVLRAKRLYQGEDGEAEQVTIDTPVPYRLSDLSRLINDAMGAFNKAESAAPYLHLLARIERVRTDRRFDFMFSSLSVRDTMAQVLSRVLRIPVEGRPITIIDISGVPSEIVDVAVSVLVRLIFEFKLWSERDQAPPVLLVCEEAHRYIPGDPSAGFAPTKRAIDRIAKEGRKYGIALCLVSQRPGELSTSSLSQCNTVFALRMSNEQDQAFVRRTLPESSRWLVEALPALNNREAIAVGDGVVVPMHVRFEDLDPEHCPAGGSAPFAGAWQADSGAEFIEAAIERWRRQIR